MEYEILESLDAVGYERSLDNSQFSILINAGFKNEEFRELIQWLVNEISNLAEMDEKITQIEDVNQFLIEFSGFLKEVMCPYEVLVHSHAQNKMLTVESRYLLLEYLISELMGVKMSIAIKPKDDKNVITLHESPTAAALKDIAITLSLGKPPENISPKALFEKVNTRLNETFRTIPNSEKRLGKPLFNPKKQLSDEQWKKLERLQKDLDVEYNMRRKMLITRLNCTVQSFKWSEKIKFDKNKERDITERFSTKVQAIDKLQAGSVDTDLAALLAVRDSLAIIEKTSSANVRKNTKSKIQRHIIGRVPDRGGRAYEHSVPPPEMPSWQKQRTAGPTGGFQNQNRGGGGGGYQQNRGGGGGYSGGQGQGHQQNQGYQGRGQNQNYNQGGGYNQQQNYQQQNYNSYDNRDNRDNSNRGGRVQGGWSQKGGQGGYQGNNYDQQRGGGGYRGGRR